MHNASLRDRRQTWVIGNCSGQLDVNEQMDVEIYATFDKIDKSLGLHDTLGSINCVRTSVAIQ